jgi:hypothetical protein
MHFHNLYDINYSFMNTLSKLNCLYIIYYWFNYLILDFTNFLLKNIGIYKYIKNYFLYCIYKKAMSI